MPDGMSHIVYERRRTIRSALICMLGVGAYKLRMSALSVGRTIAASAGASTVEANQTTNISTLSRTHYCG